LWGNFGKLLGEFLSSVFQSIFGLRAFGKLLVLLCFFAFEGGSGPVFGPIFGVLFIIREFMCLLGMVVFQVCVESQVIFVGRRGWNLAVAAKWGNQAPKRSKTRFRKMILLGR
jgi:hypothetical protein